jgi:hypothetical protein
MSTTTWSAAKALPRASEAALPNCSTNHAWNFETPIVIYVQGCAARFIDAARAAAATLRPLKRADPSALSSSISWDAFPLRERRARVRRSATAIISSDGWPRHLGVKRLRFRLDKG